MQRSRELQLFALGYRLKVGRERRQLQLSSVFGRSRGQPCSQGCSDCVGHLPRAFTRTDLADARSGCQSIARIHSSERPRPGPSSAPSSSPTPAPMDRAVHGLSLT